MYSHSISGGFMKRNIVSIIVFLIFAVLMPVTGCRETKSDNSSIILALLGLQKTVYSAGFYSSDGSNYLPCYWKGADRLSLISDGNNGEAKSIVAAGGKVYTAGYCEVESKDVPCYWVGTVKHDLPIPPGADEGWGNYITI